MNVTYKKILKTVCFVVLLVSTSQSALLFKKSCPQLSPQDLCALGQEGSNANQSNSLNNLKVRTKDKPFLKRVCTMEQDLYFKRSSSSGGKCECSYDIVGTGWFGQGKEGTVDAGRILTIMNHRPTPQLQCPILTFSEVKRLVFDTGASIQDKNGVEWALHKNSWIRTHLHTQDLKVLKRRAGTPQFVKAHKGIFNRFCTYFVPEGNSPSQNNPNKLRPIIILQRERPLGVPPSISRDPIKGN